MVTLLHIGFVLAVAGLALAVFRWISAKSKWLGLMVAAGVLLRVVGGVTAFAISYFDAPVMRGLHTGGGFWSLALDSRLYYSIVSQAASINPFSITSDTSSPGYTIPLALWLAGTGISVLSAILFNAACYLATAAVLVAGWSDRHRGTAASWTPVMVAAFTFSPVLLLTSTQVLKDPFFAMLIAMACRSAFGLFEFARRPITDRPVALFCTAAASVVLLTLIGAVRAYYAVFLWLAFLAGFAVLVFIGKSSVWPRPRRALTGVAVVAALWLAFAIGSGPYYAYYRTAFAGNGVADEIEASRRSFVYAGGGTNMAPTPTSAPAGQAPAATSPAGPVGIVTRVTTGLLAIFVPMSILKMTPLVTFAGGKGLLLIADLDTIFLDATILLLALTVWRQRPALQVRAPAVTFILTLAGISTVLLAYVVTNFGTLLRLRLFVAAPIWLALLSVGSIDAKPASSGEPIARRVPAEPPDPRVLAWLGLAAFLAVLLVPGAPDSSFSGVPLAWPGLVGLTAGLAAMALVGLIRPFRPMADAWIIALVVAAMFKATMAFGATTFGWRGTYELVAGPQAITVVFTDGLAEQPFRIDKQIDFEGPTFKFPFELNSAKYGQPTGRETPDVEAGLRVRWTGFVSLPVAAPMTWSARCRGSLWIQIDSEDLFKSDCPAEAFTITAPEPAVGTHRVSVGYIKPAGVSPLAVFSSLEGSRVVPLRIAAGAQTRSEHLNSLTTTAGWTACVLMMLALAGCYVPVRATTSVRVPGTVGRLVVLGVLVILLGVACRAAYAYRDVPIHVGESDAALAVESRARDLLLNGLRPWRGATLYEVALAVSHGVVGQERSAAVFLNLASLATIVPLCWWIGWRRFGRAATLVAAVAMAVACTWYVWPVVTTTVDATFFTAMALLAAAATLRAMESRAGALWLTALAATGAAVATRPSFVIYGLVVAGLFAFTRRSLFSIWWALAAATAGGAVVAGQWGWRAELPLFGVLLFGLTLVIRVPGSQGPRVPGS